MDLSIQCNDNNYTLHVNSYNSKAETLNITFIDIKENHELCMSTVRNLRFSNILKTKRTVNHYYYKYNVNDVITSNNRNLKVLERILTTNKAYICLCLNCFNIDIITEKVINRGSNCLVCNNKTTITGAYISGNYVNNKHKIY